MVPVEIPVFVGLARRLQMVRKGRQLRPPIVLDVERIMEGAGELCVLSGQSLRDGRERAPLHFQLVHIGINLCTAGEKIEVIQRKKGEPQRGEKARTQGAK